MTSKHALRIVVTRLVLAGAATSAGACSGGDPKARIDPIGPDRASFEPVARTLVKRCGTLDCHGSVVRNFRIYGYGGLRLRDDGGGAAPDDGDIRPGEVSANYDAVIGLEPEIMRDVVRDRGARPERLELVRKGRGEESHKGGAAMVRGDDADRCFVSWLASSTDHAACALAAPAR